MASSPNNFATSGCRQSYIDGADQELKSNIWPRAKTLWMTAFYLALIIIRPWEIMLPWMNAYFPFQKTYALIILVAIMLSARTRFRMSTQTSSVCLFAVSLGISGLMGQYSSLAWELYYAYLTVVFLYFILVTVIRTSYDLIFMALSYVAIMFVYLLKSLWEFFVHGHCEYTMGVKRLIGIEHLYGSPNGLAGSIVHSLPILYFLWVTRKYISAEWPGVYKKLLPWFLFLYLCLAGTSIILTNSRAGFVCALLFLFLIVWEQGSVSKKIGYVIIAALACSLLWTVMPESNKGRFRTIWSPESGPASAEQSAKGRFAGFHAGVEIFQEFPVTGVGLGGFSRYRQEAVDGSTERAHNLIGQLLGTTGLLGTGTFFIMIYTILVNSRKTRKLSKGYDDPTLKSFFTMAQATRMMVVLLFFQGFFGHNMLRFNWLLVAAFSILSFQLTQQYLDKQKQATL